MKYACKCSYWRCRKRRTLSKHPDLYKQPPKCECGRREWTVDEHRQNRKPGWNAPLCNCDGRPFPHRKNDYQCRHYEDYQLEMNLKNTKVRFHAHEQCPF